MDSTIDSGAMLDPVTVEVVRHKLDGIANEMELTLLKSSFSPIVKEGLDASASLFTLQGETLAQAVAIPIHLATLIPCVARIVDEFPIGTMREGDLYCMNDPYLGGTHLPDIAVLMPVFARGRPLAFAAAMTHHQDVAAWRQDRCRPTPPRFFRKASACRRSSCETVTGSTTPC